MNMIALLMVKPSQDGKNGALKLLLVYVSSTSISLERHDMNARGQGTYCNLIDVYKCTITIFVDKHA